MVIISRNDICGFYTLICPGAWVRTAGSIHPSGNGQISVRLHDTFVQPMLEWNIKSFSSDQSPDQKKNIVLKNLQPCTSGAQWSAYGKANFGTVCKVTDGMVMILLKLGCELPGGQKTLFRKKSKQQAEKPRSWFIPLTPRYATELEQNPNVWVLNIPQFIWLQPGRDLGFWIYN